MITKLSDTDKWSLIIIKDPKLLPGTSILNVLKDILTVNAFKFAAFNDIYGALISSFVEIEGDVIEIDKLLELLPEVKQFDWGNFLLFNEYPKNWPIYKDALFPSLFRITDSTIRAVDDEYIYIYTPKQEIVDHIKSLSEKYNIESIDVDLLGNLPYPE